MGIWGRAFPPKEVKASLLALSIQVDRLSKNSDLYAAICIVEPKVKDAIETLPEKVKNSIINDGFSPDDLVRIMIRNRTHDEISSGKFHVYRGVLIA